jgi:hypothetical protein
LISKQIAWIPYLSSIFNEQIKVDYPPLPSLPDGSQGYGRVVLRYENLKSKTKKPTRWWAYKLVPFQRNSLKREAI